MIYLIYALFFFLILRFSVTLFNFLSNPKLTPATKKYNAKVSVLIPARNEASDITTLLFSLKNQEYKNIEVIILDDNSDDDTHQVCQDFSITDDRFKVIKGEELKKNWLGKNFACHQLAQHASGEYLLFLDADELVKDGLINSALHRMQTAKLNLLSLFSNQIMHTMGEKMVVPMMHFILLNLLPLRLVRLLKNPELSAASGQFMLFNAENYHQNQWHKQVKNQVVEDIEIMKLIKLKGFKGEALLANGFIYCRMYKSYAEAINGFSKNILSGFGNSKIALLLYLFLILFGPILMSFYLNTELVVFYCALIVLTRLMISLLSGQNALINIIIHPLQVLSLGIISICSIYNSVFKKTYWKGRKIL